ncbi:hypothetical protein HMPREF9056_02125 [Actinomyces sp. oral taxon 170 str. F0386]|nr:hypothetical protein HMPREF9056_02125 [Actinomyces sp. oral taxon 170 str. F0386]
MEKTETTSHVIRWGSEEETWLDAVVRAPSQGRREPERTICLRPSQNARTRQRIHMPAPRRAMRAVRAWATFMCFSVATWLTTVVNCHGL